MSDNRSSPGTVHQFASEYEFRGDGCDHVPTNSERAMIEDAIEGYLAQSITIPAMTPPPASEIVESIIKDWLSDYVSHLPPTGKVSRAICEALTGVAQEPGNADEVGYQLELLRARVQDAADLLLERKQGSHARSAAHNARLLLESALSSVTSTTHLEGCPSGDFGPCDCPVPSKVHRDGADDLEHLDGMLDDRERGA